MSIYWELRHGPANAASDLHENHMLEKDHFLQNWSETEQPQEKRK